MNSNSGSRIRNICGINLSSLLPNCKFLGRYRNHQPALEEKLPGFPLCAPIQKLLLTGGAYSVENICKELCLYQMRDAVDFSKESYENESIVSGTAETLAKQSFPALSVMLIEHTNSQSKIVTHGLPDRYLYSYVP